MGECMLLINDENLQYAVLFEKVDLCTLDFPIFRPKRPMIGYITDDRSVFTEVISGSEYFNFYYEIDSFLLEGFELSSSLNDVMSLTGKYILEEALVEMWSQVKDSVFFYDSGMLEEELTFVMLSDEEFSRNFGLSFKINKQPFQLEISSGGSLLEQNKFNRSQGRLIKLFDDKK